MDLLVLCLTAACVELNSKTDFHLSTLDIACKQLTTSSCEAHLNWTNRCSERKKLNGSEGEPSTLHQDPKGPHRGEPDVIQYSPNISLHQACEEGKLDVVKYILSQGMEDINCRGKMGRTPVMTAVRAKHVKVFEYLVSKGCDLSAVNEYKTSVLHYACIGGTTEIVRKLIVNERLDIESIGYCGRTPILYAAYHGHTEVFELLVQNGCNTLIRTKQNDNVLHLACERDHVDLVRHILSHKLVSIESRGSLGRTPILTAALFGKLNVFEFLVGKGGNVYAVDDNKSNILHLACMGGHIDMVKHTISLNIVSKESRGFIGRTAVLITACYGNTKLLDVLLRKGCKETAVDDGKNNILHVACWGGFVNMVQHILSLNLVSMESRGFAGRTPVLTTARYGKIKVFDFLIRKGCNLNAVDDDKNNVLHLACQGGFTDMVQHILSLNIVSIDTRGFAGKTPVLIAARFGKTEVFKFLVGKDCNLSVVDDKNNNILHEACMGGHVVMVRNILSLDIVNINSRGAVGRTPVMVAAEFGTKDVVDFLVEKGAKIRAVDNEKNNILHAACMGGHVDMVKHVLLLTAVKGMENLKNKYGRTPLQVADRLGYTAVVNVLKDRKYDESP